MRSLRTKLTGAETGSASRSAPQLLQRLQTLEYAFSVAPLHDFCMIETTHSERPFEPRLSLTRATRLMAGVPVGPGGVVFPLGPKIMSTVLESRIGVSFKLCKRSGYNVCLHHTGVIITASTSSLFIFAK